MSLYAMPSSWRDPDVNGVDISDLVVNREKLLLQVLHPRPARIRGQDRELGSGPIHA